MCGKNYQFIPFCFIHLGSPPRVREKPRGGNVPGGRVGITPACAGKTEPITAYKSKFWDHPRVCGKNPLLQLEAMSLGGSPPRVREKLLLRPFIWIKKRITPACAGKTSNYQH